MWRLPVAYSRCSVDGDNEVGAEDVSAECATCTVHRDLTFHAVDQAVRGERVRYAERRTIEVQKSPELDIQRPHLACGVDCRPVKKGRRRWDEDVSGTTGQARSRHPVQALIPHTIGFTRPYRDTARRYVQAVQHLDTF